MQTFRILLKCLPKGNMFRITRKSQFMCRRLLGLPLLTAFLIVLFSNNNVMFAQGAISVNCNSDGIQPSLPGTYFHIIEEPDIATNTNYRVEAISVSGSQQYSLPLPPETGENLFDPSFSPDGRYVVFRPASTEVGLTVWDLQTNAVASLSLQLSDFEYLNPSPFNLSYQRDRDLLIWLDSSHLLLRYFNDPANDFDKAVYKKKKFSINESPLSINEAAEEVIVYPNLPIPNGNKYPAIEFSPDHRYATRISYQSIYGHVEILPGLQIYDIQLTPNLVYDTIPTAESYPNTLPIWMPDGNTAFILFRSLDYRSRSILELHSNEDFREDLSLQQTLNDTFGTKVLPGGMDPAVSPSGQHIIFSAYVPTTEKNYFVRYTPSTKQITAICDTESLGTGNESYFFWVPGERYFAFWTTSDVHVISLEDGTRFTLPSNYFSVGWVEQDIFAPTNQAPVASAGADQTVTAADGISAQVTLDGSGSSDSDGSIVNYVWVENDTQIATGETAQVLLTVGTHVITLTVADDDGATDSDEVTITVNAAPTAFPANPVLDDFNRADGSLGANWYGSTGSYSIVNQQAQVVASGDLQWTASAFSANQEVFVTLTSINPASTEINLRLKTQLNYAMIEVLYQPAASAAAVWTYAPEQGWVQRGAAIPISLTAGDQFGARALADGTVAVYHNGGLLAARDVRAWPYNLLGGYLGVSMLNASGTRLEDFGGGDVTAALPAVHTYSVSASADDVNEANAVLDQDRTLVWIGNAGTSLPGYAGFRFTNVTIPPGANIQSAHLQVIMPYNQWIDIAFTLVGEAADTSAPFTSSARPSQRAVTSAQVAHASSANWVAQNWYSLGEIGPVIQEIVNRSGWQSGNSLSVLLRGPGGGSWGRKFIVSWDGNPMYAPRLVLSYTLPGG